MVIDPLAERNLFSLVPHAMGRTWDLDYEDLDQNPHEITSVY